MRPDVFVAPIESILEDPHYFPVHIDFDRDCLTFVPTSRERLAATPFQDGRTVIAEGQAVEVSLSEALAAGWTQPPAPDRLIFHIAFCGSTLLSTLLDLPGHSFAEREPNVLVELADAALVRDRNTIVPALNLMRALLRRPWQPGERNLCKPSNWANNLIPLLSDPGRIRPLFVVTDKRSYLDALFRGGRPRMEYVVRATDHLLRATGTSPDLWRRATSGVADPLEVPARVALLSLHIQLELFEEAMRRGRWGRAQLLTLDHLEEDPRDACRHAAQALDLDLPAAALDAAISQRFYRYAKAPEHAYSPEEAMRVNRQIERDYGRVMDRALDWAALCGLRTDCGVLERRPEGAAA